MKPLFAIPFDHDDDTFKYPSSEMYQDLPAREYMENEMLVRFSELWKRHKIEVSYQSLLTMLGFLVTIVVVGISLLIIGCLTFLVEWNSLSTMNTWLIIGICVGSMAILMIVLICVLIYIFHKRKLKDECEKSMINLINREDSYLKKIYSLGIRFEDQFIYDNEGDVVQIIPIMHIEDYRTTEMSGHSSTQDFSNELSVDPLEMDSQLSETEYYQSLMPENKV